MADEAKEETKEAKKGGMGKLFLFSGVGLVVVIGAAFAFATFAVPALPAGSPSGAASGEGGTAEGEAGDDQPKLVFNVPSIMVNLKGTKKKRVLKLQLNLVYRSDNPEEAPLGFDAKMPEIKDALITLLTEKTLDELESREHMNLLRIELKEELNRVVFPDGKGEIQSIFYEDFIVQ